MFPPLFRQGKQLAALIGFAATFPFVNTPLYAETALILGAAEFWHQHCYSSAIERYRQHPEAPVTEFRRFYGNHI
ncbi:hypothetical protein [Marinobacter sp. ANT_B65]|uniref:hypothetical protein n=1 Tax=Marinobacter sp. ANT_B65 TaxID=2039467 RepID=UPI000BBE2EB8|nr:hypothetical protein [Marinobacter sp. ANT_B65]PCM46078.1 hypothetical protein CPA50_09040 [Marinobacter sp. ANT_B65]